MARKKTFPAVCGAFKKRVWDALCKDARKRKMPVSRLVRHAAMRFLENRQPEIGCTARATKTIRAFAHSTLEQAGVDHGQ